MFRVLAVAVVVTTGAVGPAHAASTFINWPQYLASARHSSMSPATGITPANAAHLRRSWTWKPAMPTSNLVGLWASPTVVDGTIYIGSLTGDLYAVSETTGQTLWTSHFAYPPPTSCGSFGIASTVAVANDPVTGAPTVYLYAGDGELHALDAHTGVQRWASVVYIPSESSNDYAAWSSPTVARGRIYVGLSSDCDTPLIRGGLRSFAQSNGAPIATYYSAPAGSVGDSVWSSAAVSAGGKYVYVTTGNGPAGDSDSVVQLNAVTLAKVARWGIPTAERITDSDFGASPTLFTASIGGVPTPMIGACNKNGIYYALRATNLTAGPVWQRRLGQPANGNSQCDAASIWGGSHLFAGSNATTINGIAYAGSIREIDPATGAFLWQAGLPGAVLGSPSLDSAGVIAAATWQRQSTTAPGTYLLGSTTGRLLARLPLRTLAFSQQVYADNYLLSTSQGDGITAYHP